MENVILLALVATIGTWFITAMGAATVVFFKEGSPKAMNLMLGFSAGVMFAASFWSLLSPAIERSEMYLSVPPWFVAAIGFAFGSGFMFLCDKAVRKISAKGETTRSISSSLLLVISITLHNIPEGLAVGVAFGAINQSVNMPEALMGAISIGQSSALVEPVAGVIGAAMVIHIQTMLPYALAFAAGAMMLVAVHELIPQAQEGRKEGSFLYTMGILGGFALMMILDVALG